VAIDREDVRRIAELARLEVSEADEPRMAAELSSVLDLVAVLERLDLEGCEPTAFAPADAPLRDDEPNGRRLTPEQALAAAPESDGSFFIVPPIVENLNP
jgi:aspartyl-tRNA(Asn)/glutamyl-tRNA(Gln) amidotransferase subunit C